MAQDAKRYLTRQGRLRDSTHRVDDLVWAAANRTLQRAVYDYCHIHDRQGLPTRTGVADYPLAAIRHSRDHLLSGRAPTPDGRANGG